MPCGAGRGWAWRGTMMAWSSPVSPGPSGACPANGAPKKGLVCHPHSYLGSLRLNPTLPPGDEEGTAHGASAWGPSPALRTSSASSLHFTSDNSGLAGAGLAKLQVESAVGVAARGDGRREGP